MDGGVREASGDFEESTYISDLFKGKKRWQ